MSLVPTLTQSQLDNMPPCASVTMVSVLIYKREMFLTSSVVPIYDLRLVEGHEIDFSKNLDQVYNKRHIPLEELPQEGFGIIAYYVSVRNDYINLGLQWAGLMHAESEVGLD